LRAVRQQHPWHPTATQLPVVRLAAVRHDGPEVLAAQRFANVREGQEVHVVGRVEHAIRREFGTDDAELPPDVAERDDQVVLRHLAEPGQ
jgi:hypothetical protein